MANYSIKNITAAGFAAGLAVAACCSLLLWLNQGRSEILVTAIDFLAGLPVVIARKLDIPKPLRVSCFESRVSSLRTRAESE